MRSLSDQLLLAIPATVALLLLLLSALPATFGLPLTPHVVWLMTLTVVVAYPPAWPPALAFVLGLVSDFMLGTPLGAQALLSMGLTLFLQRQARRLQFQPFRVRWMQATAALLALFIALWAITGWATPPRLPIEGMFIAALVSALWFPAFHYGVQWLTKFMPGKI